MRGRRFTLRSLMVAVLLAGLGTWGYMLLLRSADFAARAYEHRQRSGLHDMVKTPIDLGHPHSAFDEGYRKYHEEWIRYEDHMFRKYRFAAFFPWLPVAPDPPASLDPLCDGRLGRRTLTKGRSLPWNWFYS